MKFTKKSEFATIIMECLVEPHFPDDIEREANYILKRLEKAGMKPPVTKRCPILLKDEHVWEQENEAQ